MLQKNNVPPGFKCFISKGNIPHIQKSTLVGFSARWELENKEIRKVQCEDTEWQMKWNVFQHEPPEELQSCLSLALYWRNENHSSQSYFFIWCPVVVRVLSNTSLQTSHRCSVELRDGDWRPQHTSHDITSVHTCMLAALLQGRYSSQMTSACTRVWAAYSVR